MEVCYKTSSIFIEPIDQHYDMLDNSTTECSYISNTDVIINLDFIDHHDDNTEEDETADNIKFLNFFIQNSRIELASDISSLKLQILNTCLTQSHIK
jgi:hypothetical protein